MSDLLLELGVEEIPARMIASAEAELARRIKDLLARERLVAEMPGDGAPGFHLTSYSTPRRLGVRVESILSRQRDWQEHLTGPSWKIAFRDNQPTPAAHAFAKKAGVEVEMLEKVANAKGEYASAVMTRPGRSAVQVLAEFLSQEISAISWPKAMYWRSNKPERFIRPLRWLLCLVDETVVPIEFAGIRAGNLTYGHRILHGNHPIPIVRPEEYLPKLASAFVLPLVAERRHRIRKALDAVTRSVPGARWREDGALLEQVTHLTEWPTALKGGFEAEYLDLPEEVLVTVMRDHQKYFALVDPQGKLVPHFLTVLNTEVDLPGETVIRHGNERVLRARFNDARFFWSYDQKISLAQRVDHLKAVTFQKDLGSYFTKTEMNLRVAEALAEALAGHGIALDEQALKEAALLAKTDLTTELVKEFTELQGIIGGLYARAQGLPEKVAQAIYAQYLPASIEDRIPATVEGQILSLADRMATLVAMFSLGLAPTGSRDPFALRRAANGVVKILAESEFPITLEALQEISIRQSARTRSGEGRDALTVFLRERLDFYLREGRGYAYDVVNAVLATGSATVADAAARAHALTQVRGSEDFVAISMAFKRIKNILRQAEEKNEIPGELLRPEDLTAPAEQHLYAEAVQLAPRVEGLRARQQYQAALENIATLRPGIDAFFDSVMVMAPEPHLRRNRLALIALVLSDFSRIADFSEIVPG